MKISVFGFTTTRRFAAIAILASFVFSNVFAVDALRSEKYNVVSTATAKYTTDLTQLGREGRLRADLSLEAETMRLIKVLGEGVRQPVVVNENKGVQQAIVEQAALRIAKGTVPANLANKTILKLETDVLFSNARTPAAIAEAVNAIIKDAIASKGQTILFIDELTSLVGSASVKNDLFTAIANGKLVMIGASSVLDYDERIDSQPEIAGFFAGILVTDRSNAVAVNEERSSAGETGFRGDNISPDLREMMEKDPTGRTRVDTILQAKDADSSVLRSLLASGQANVTDRIGSSDTLVVNLPLSTLNELSTSGTINYVSPNRTIEALGHVENTSGVAAMRAQAAGFGRTSAYTLNGANVGIAILDSGMHAGHFAFNDGGSRIATNMSFVPGETSTEDNYGHGTHVASIAAGNASRDTGSYRGIAPGAKILNLKVLNSQGKGTTAGLLAALDWIITNRATHNIRVANLSLGVPSIDTWTNDPLCRKVQSLNSYGILVVAAAGNHGKNAAGQKIYGQVHSPGNDPSVLTVGASNGLGTDSRSDDIMATYSSHGPTRSYYTDATG